jgi:hypothetical protein
MPSWKLKKKHEQYRLLLQSDSNRAIALVDRVETALLASKSDSESEAEASPKPGKKGKMKEKDKKALEAERLAKEKAEADRLAKESLERQRIEKEKLEREKVEKEKLERERAEKEKLEREKAEIEKLEQEKSQKEKLAARGAENETEKVGEGGEIVNREPEGEYQEGANGGQNGKEKSAAKVSIEVEKFKKGILHNSNDNANEAEPDTSVDDEKKVSLMNYRKYHRRSSQGPTTSSGSSNSSDPITASDPSLKKLKTKDRCSSSRHSLDSSVTSSDDKSKVFRICNLFYE